MYLIYLRFGPSKERAGEFMGSHNTWLQQGFDEGAFLASGSLPNGAGGFILARGDGIEGRVQADPFVIQGIVASEIQVLTAARMVPELATLTTGAANVT